MLLALLRRAAICPSLKLKSCRMESHHPHMKTFLRSLFVHAPSLNQADALSLKNARLTRCWSLLGSILLCAASASTSAQTLKPVDASGLPGPVASSASHGPERRRVVTLRRNETPEGDRFSLTSDAPLADYRSFAEADRVCVMIPQAAFVSQHREQSGRGFAAMRIEQRDENVMLSFRLQQGATVAVNQRFNRLEIIFMTNERANSAGPD